MGNSCKAEFNYKIVIPFIGVAHEVTSADINIARKSWQCIIGNETKAYREMKRRPEFHGSSCIGWFYDW